MSDESFLPCSKSAKSAGLKKKRPTCGAKDAICKPLAVAICTSDVHTVWEGAVGERHNLILGHECCAEVVEVGSEVRDFKPGDRVLVPAITPDWSSLEAQDGYAMHSGGMLCGWKFSNIKDGVFAEFFHVNDADGNLAHLPDSMALTDACMLSDMVPTGFHGAELADIRFGDTVLVVGIGPVGLMCPSPRQVCAAHPVFSPSAHVLPASVLPKAMAQTNSSAIKKRLNRRSGSRTDRRGA